MNLVSIFLIGLMTLQGGPIEPQLRSNEGEPGEKTYYKYEREEVSIYRDRTDFRLPEPKLPEAAKASERPDPESLSGYFDPGDTYFVDADPQLETLIQTHKEINERINQVSGYRVQVYSGTNRSQALGIKSRLMASDRQHKAYLEFVAPNFVVRLGDFMDKEEATLFFKREIEGVYRGAFVVPDQVNVPKYEDLVEQERRREAKEKAKQELADPFDDGGNNR